MTPGEGAGTSKERRVGLPSWLARRPAMNPKLIVVEGEASQDEIQVKLPMTIGRVQGNGLVIAHPLVSRKHCEIVKRDDWLWVKDYDSANGTFIGDARIQGEAVLRPGDRLKVGPLTFVAVYQQQGLIPPRIQAKKSAQAVKEGRSPDESGLSDSGVTTAPAKGAAKSASKSGTRKADKPMPAPAAASPAARPAKLDGPPAAATSSPRPLSPASSPRPASAKSPVMTAPAGAAAKSATKVDDDPFAAWARGNEKKDSAGDSGTSLDDLVDRLEAAANISEIAAELLADSDFGETEGEDTLDSDDVLAFEEVVSNYDDPGQTLVHGATPEKETYSGPVGLTAAPAALPADESSIDAEPQYDRPSNYDVMIFHLLNQSDRLQGQLLENYQQAVVTAEVVNKLQQEQLDQIRDQMDRLHELTKALQRAILTERPGIKQVCEFEDLSNLLPAPPQAADPLSEDSSSSAAMELSVEQLHQSMRKKMAASQAAEQQHWEKIRQFFRTHGIG